MMRFGIPTLLAFTILALVPAPTSAADRVRTGQWETSLTVNAGKPTTIKTCMTAKEAGFLNGGSAALRKYLEESTAENTKGRCAVKGVTVNGNTIIVTTLCGKSETTVTTTYHGESYESSSTAGATIKGKRLGACP